MEKMMVLNVFLKDEKHFDCYDNGAPEGYEGIDFFDDDHFPPKIKIGNNEIEARGGWEAKIAVCQKGLIVYDAKKILYHDPYLLVLFNDNSKCIIKDVSTYSASLVV